MIEHVQRTGQTANQMTDRNRHSVGLMEKAKGPRRKNKLFVEFRETMFRKTAGAGGVPGRSATSMPGTARQLDNRMNTSSTMTSAMGGQWPLKPKASSNQRNPSYAGNKT